MQFKVVMKSGSCSSSSVASGFEMYRIVSDTENYTVMGITLHNRCKNALSYFSRSCIKAKTNHDNKYLRILDTQRRQNITNENKRQHQPQTIFDMSINQSINHLALQPFVGFRLLSQVIPSSSILSCFFLGLPRHSLAFAVLVFLLV
jgi:hypothetical protein